MKSLIIFGIMISIVFSLGILPIADAHPHTTIDLMETHSHNVEDDNFQENFIVHSFEHVIISTFDWFKNVLFG